MISYVLLLSVVDVVVSQSCYWNDGCPYQLFSSKTPYDTVRGDIRDYRVLQNCEAVSVWSLNRHGNRNPGASVTDDISIIAGLKDEIVNSFRAGRGELCAQDIDDFKNWRWNETLEVSESSLTGIGYEELYNIGRRIREKYPHLLEGSVEDYYFRTTNEQRTVTSSVAFVHGLTQGTNLSLPIDGPWEQDDIIRPYESCDRYQQEVKGSQALEDQLNAYYKTSEFIAVQNNVQRRLGIPTNLSPDDIYSFYEICRFYRSWEPNLKSPWCSAFSAEDLVVLEYSDDVRHYYRNGYGSWVNEDLGRPVIKDLYQSMEAAMQGEGKKVVAYFTHDTMIEMALCAMGLFKDEQHLQGAIRNPNRLWRTSSISCFSSNILAVLNSCESSGNQTYRVQLFFNEKPTELCPLEGCDWQTFSDKFRGSLTANLEFCTLEARAEGDAPGAAVAVSFSSLVFVSSLILAITVN